MRRFFSVLFAVVEKDLRLEWRTKESLLVMVVFALLVLTLFSFAFGPGGGSGENARAVQAGILWISFLFACVIGLSRTMSVERESAGFSAMYLSPSDPSALYLGKVVSVAVLMGIMELVGFAVLAVLYQANVWKSAGALALVAISATVGIAAAGTLFSAMSARTRTREVLLPVLMFPVLVPVLIAAVKATEAHLGGGGWVNSRDWIRLILVYDVVFLVAASLVFEYILEE